MRRSKKQKRKLDARIDGWRKMTEPGGGGRFVDEQTISVGGYYYHKPGSQK